MSLGKNAGFALPSLRDGLREAKLCVSLAAGQTLERPLRRVLKVQSVTGLRKKLGVHRKLADYQRVSQATMLDETPAGWEPKKRLPVRQPH